MVLLNLATPKVAPKRWGYWTSKSKLKSMTKCDQISTIDCDKILATIKSAAKHNLHGWVYWISKSSLSGTTKCGKIQAMIVMNLVSTKVAA